MKTWYIAGPMTGIAQFNIPMFDMAARVMRANGDSIISPAELDSPEMRAFALASPDGRMPADGKIAGESWGDVLARDVKIISDRVVGITVLPYWCRSRGARLEVFVGLLTGKKFRSYDPDTEWVSDEIDPEQIRQILRENMP